MDRNVDNLDGAAAGDTSLSARRAWIEIVHFPAQKSGGAASLSARRAWIEIVFSVSAPRTTSSLSARRAWIEILSDAPKAPKNPVALRKESVDRNNFSWSLPHLQLPSLSARRAWIEIGLQTRTLPHCWRRSPQGERG